MAADAAAGQFKDLVDNFKKMCEDSMKGQADAWPKLLQSGQANFTEIQKLFIQGYEEMLQQLLTANRQLLEQLADQYKRLREQLKSAYTNQMEKASNTPLEKQLDTFKKNCEDILKKYPMLPPTLHESAINDLKAMQGKIKADIKKQYQALMDHLEKNYNDTVKKMTIPESLKAQIPSGAASSAHTAK